MSMNQAFISKLLAALCLLLLTLPCCKSSDVPTISTPVSGDALNGTQWKLISLDGSPPVSGSYISLYFNNGGMWGSAGINIYGVQYSIQSPDIIIPGMGSITEMGGPEYLMRQETRYAKLIFKASYFSIDNTYLNIVDANRVQTLTFERLPEYPVDPADLIGTKWQLTLINTEPVIEGLSITLNFESDQAAGQSGCFEYTLFYEEGLFDHPGDNVRWGNSSKRTGELPYEQEHQASSYLDKIAVAAHFNVTGDRLEIYTARGDTLVFKPVENESSATGIPHVYTKIEAALTLDGTEPGTQIPRGSTVYHWANGITEVIGPEGEMIFVAKDAEAAMLPHPSGPNGPFESPATFMLQLPNGSAVSEDKEQKGVTRVYLGSELILTVINESEDFQW